MFSAYSFGLFLFELWFINSMFKISNTWIIVINIGGKTVYFNWQSLDNNSIIAPWPFLCSLHCPFLIFVTTIFSNLLLLLLLLNSCLLNRSNKLLKILRCSIFVVCCVSKISATACIILIKWLIISCPIEIWARCSFIFRFRVSFWFKVFIIIEPIGALSLSLSWSASITGSTTFEWSFPGYTPPSFSAIHESLNKFLLSKSRTILTITIISGNLAATYNHIAIFYKSTSLVNKSAAFHYYWFALLVHYVLEMWALVVGSMHLLIISRWVIGQAVLILGWCLAV